jgi:hypothetical protein
MGTPLSPDEIRAAAAVHHELGPEYADDVVASFLDRIDQEITARIDARLGARTRLARGTNWTSGAARWSTAW